MYERYGVHKDRATCELDHLVPLELGGADTLDNLWPECGPFGAEGLKVYFKEKDLVEDYLTASVKNGSMRSSGSTGRHREGLDPISRCRIEAMRYCASRRCSAEQ